ncbi:hypothetical protein HPB52_022036 [Rhipicephalus sanguineus]|uniref:THAP-type domain-containing protein n=1 Tax=Rhipicephalus sanguineus TaxID=34632 RepID=A0A9D4PSJ1_RHISA|nr:hypothetical protein HPB52_022036 [Rhipicephalus sanguineus]
MWTTAWAGCTNGPRRRLKGSGSVNPTISFHVVPRGEPRRSQWLNAVPMIRRQKEPEKPMLSSLHFSPSDYVYNRALGKALGVPKSGVLSRSAVPLQKQTSVSVSVEFHL